MRISGKSWRCQAPRTRSFAYDAAGRLAPSRINLGNDPTANIVCRTSACAATWTLVRPEIRGQRISAFDWDFAQFSLPMVYRSSR